MKQTVNTTSNAPKVSAWAIDFKRAIANKYAKTQEHYVMLVRDTLNDEIPEILG